MDEQLQVMADQKEQLQYTRMLDRSCQNVRPTLPSTYLRFFELFPKIAGPFLARSHDKGQATMAEMGTPMKQAFDAPRDVKGCRTEGTSKAGAMGVKMRLMPYRMTEDAPMHSTASTRMPYHLFVARCALNFGCFMANMYRVRERHKETPILL